jgi:hypothetical protein
MRVTGCESITTCIPKATIANESPTRIMSIPPSSATRPEGKSWAVIMAMGVLFACMARRVFMVTFLRGGGAVGEIGECDEYLSCCTASRRREAAAAAAAGEAAEAAERERSENNSDDRDGFISAINNQV